MRVAVPAVAVIPIVLAAGMLARLEAAVVGRPLLVVRTYHVIPIQPRDWKSVMRSATEILNRAGIDVDWVHCVPENASRPETVPARCVAPYRDNEVALRIVRRPAAPIAGNKPLGDSLIDASTHSGMLATVYLDHAERLAHEAGVSSNTVLARAIAHELGHLMLGTSTHSAYGLMRPVWTAGELARDRSVDWTIPADEAQNMRRALARRGESTLAAALPTANPEPALGNTATLVPEPTEAFTP
jgi:hypothetical protein